MNLINLPFSLVAAHDKWPEYHEQYENLFPEHESFHLLSGFVLFVSHPHVPPPGQLFHFYLFVLKFAIVSFVSLTDNLFPEWPPQRAGLKRIHMTSDIY